MISWYNPLLYLTTLPFIRYKHSRKLPSWSVSRLNSGYQLLPPAGLCKQSRNGVTGLFVCLCCLMTPGLSKDILCHVWPYFFYFLQTSANQQIRLSDIRPHIKWAVSLVILHMVTSISLQGLCGYICVNILTLSPQRGGVTGTPGIEALSNCTHKSSGINFITKTHYSVYTLYQFTLQNTSLNLPHVSFFLGWH